jgi:uncharacterized membrane protein YcaP (DUF421 family)
MPSLRLTGPAVTKPLLFQSLIQRTRTKIQVMWHSALPWWEFILRGLIIYVFLLVILRVTGKRQVGQLAPFDLVLLLVLSNAVQNAMNGGDNSVTGGVISATTLIVANGIVGRITYKSKTMERLIEGRPEILIHNGKLFTDVMDREKLTHHEVNAALRTAGCACVEEVQYAILENTGQITVHPRKRAESKTSS